MAFFQLFILLLSLFSEAALADKDLDQYYDLEETIANLRTQLRDTQNLIAETSKVSDKYWSKETSTSNLKRLYTKQSEIIQELQVKIDEKESIGKTIEVKAWEYQLGTLRQVNKLITDVSYHNTCHQFFVNDESFEAWNAQNGSLDQKVAYYANKIDYISDCLKNQKAGELVKVNTTSQKLCKINQSGSNEYRTSPVKYKVYKENGLVNIETSIYFNYEGREEDKAESIRRVEQTKPCIENFFARHGIKLNLTFTNDASKKERRKCDHQINLHNERTKVDSSNWVTHQGFSGYQYNLESDDLRCRVYLHELGHRLNLADTYPDPNCPDRELIGPYDDVMRGVSSQVDSADDRKLYDNHIRAMLRPLCEK